MRIDRSPRRSWLLAGTLLAAACFAGSLAGCASEPPPMPEPVEAPPPPPPPEPEPEPAWGEVRWLWGSTNIRAKRTTESAVVGKLKPGEQVRVDFLRDNWYAVFRPDQRERKEAYALGYVYAPLLKTTPPAGSASGRSGS